MKTSQKTIQSRLAFMTSMFIANLAIIGGVEIWSSKSLETQMNDIAKVQLPAIRNMTLVDMMHDGLRAVVYKAILDSDSKSKQGAEEAKAEYAEFSKNIYTYAENINQLNIKPETKQAIAESIPKMDKYVEQGKQIVELCTQLKSEQAKALLKEFAVAFEDLEGNFEKLGEQIEKDAEESDKQADLIADRSHKINLAAMSLGFLFALMNAYFAIRELTRVLTQITQELSEESKALLTAVDNINAASQSLSESTTQQSAAIEETVSSMEEITSMIAQTAQHSNATQSESHNATESARSGKVVVTRMVESMEEISHANEKLQTIVKVIDEIKNKTKVINDIAFETRLLSFNASIEAARAGAHGRGFAVVAEEVGKLASVSSKAADDVRDLLDSSLTQVGQIVEETKSRVSDGHNRSRECENAFNIMENSLGTIGQSVQLISSATKEQEGGVRQTNQAMNEMEKAMQTNSRSADRLATEAQNMAAAAKLVDNTVARLKSLVAKSDQSTLVEAKNQLPTKTIDNTPERSPKAQPSKPIEVSTEIANSKEAHSKVSRNDKRWGA